MSSNIIKVVLFIVVLFLAFLVYESIMKPLRFNNEVNLRSKQVVQNLMTIRMAQVTYKTISGKFPTSFDTLITFLKKAEIPVIKIVPDPTDTIFTRTIRDTLGYVPVIDSLFKNRPGFNVDEIRYIPYTNKQLFTLNARIIDKGGVTVNVFEDSSLYDLFLKGLDKQSVVNLIATKDQFERFPGLKAGSTTEASTDGNWE